ncbi:unnamed protein product [marine sediment metagenome]|uniref:Uncharacterized protein n=1 Tax=marine sediment metagenome TaxID=412755 RepID=X0VYB5_9ZZZZ
MKSVKNVSYQQILNNLMDSEHDLGMKSRIPKPLNLAVLDSIGKYEKNLNLKDSSGMVSSLVQTLLIFFVSDKGLGRQEIVQALTPMIEAERHLQSNSGKIVEQKRD